MTKPLKTLIIKLRYIGDTVLTTPVIRTLRESGVSGPIDLLVFRNTAAVLADCPAIRKIHDLDPARMRDMIYGIRRLREVNRENYDLVLDLTRNDRSSLFTFATRAPMRLGYAGNKKMRQGLAYTRVVPSVLGHGHVVDHHLKMAEVLGVGGGDGHPCLAVSAASADTVRRILASCGGNPDVPYAVIHPGARRPYKSWPLGRFARLADAMNRTFGIQAVLSGGPEDQPSVREIMGHMKGPAMDLAGRVELRYLPALIQSARCLIGNDSAAIHIGTAVRTPVIALFGPTLWETWGPRRKTDTLLAAEFPCRPCGHSRPSCPRGEDYCMSAISYDSVWEAVRKTLSAVLP